MRTSTFQRGAIKRKRPSTTRQTVNVSRSAEFLTEPELTKRMGLPRKDWPIAITKELLDNAADHCEEIGRLPDLSVTLTTDHRLIVEDNGEGLAPETVTAMLDFNRRVSSRVAYQTPTRGSQGNASKCLFGVPYVLNGEAGKTVVVARGVRHEVTLRFDPIQQEPVIDHQQFPEKVQIGTKLDLALGEKACLVEPAESARFVLFCRAYATLNPHVTLVLELPNGDRHEWQRTSDSCKKWSAAKPEPPRWYDVAALERLAGACIAKDRETETDRTLSDFLRIFAGMSRSDARAKVLEETSLARAKLAAALVAENGDLDRAKCEQLLRAIQRHGATTPVKSLGCIGRPHVGAIFERIGTGDIKYKKSVGDRDGLPFVVEAAFAERTDGIGEPIIITGCNFSPAVDPDRHVVSMLAGLLERQKIADNDASVVMLLHVTLVAPVFTDTGKGTLHVEPFDPVAKAIRTCVQLVTDGYRKRRTREERDADALQKQREAESRRRSSSCSLKDAIFEVLPAAISEVTSGGKCPSFSNRDLYYAVRPKIQELTDKQLKQGWFDAVVDEWEMEHGLIEGRERDPRGFFLEPHSRIRIPLGTSSVEKYEIPLYQFDTILYVEKKGQLSKFEYGQIGQRYDCGIMACEGYAVRAAKALIHAAQRGHAMKVLCFHDADPDGYNIARTISQSTGAHQFNIEVIDVGLHMKEALAMGLPTERFVRKKALPSDVKWSKTDLKCFRGTPRTVITKTGKNRTVYEGCERVELNALSADPDAFVAWVEKVLKRHGVARKLVPPPAIAQARAEQRLYEIIEEKVSAEVNHQLDLPVVVATLTQQFLARATVKDVPGLLDKWASKTLPEAWTAPIDRAARKSIGHLHAKIERAVREELK